MKQMSNKYIPSRVTKMGNFGKKYFHSIQAFEFYRKLHLSNLSRREKYLTEANFPYYQIKIEQK